MQDIKALKAENIFVVLSLIVGLFYLVINPPFQAPDEAQHMFKMWGYTQGTLRFKVAAKLYRRCFAVEPYKIEPL